MMEINVMARERMGNTPTCKQLKAQSTESYVRHEVVINTRYFIINGSFDEGLYWQGVIRLITRPVESPHKGPVTRKMFPSDDVIMHEVDTKRQLFASVFIDYCYQGPKSQYVIFS